MLLLRQLSLAIERHFYKNDTILSWYKRHISVAIPGLNEHCQRDYFSIDQDMVQANNEKNV